MIEIRWHCKVLQYRVKYDPTVSEGHTNINVGRFNPYLEWSEWKDVEEVNDADKNS